MLIIPVLDLMRGQVVHAKKGARHEYQAIQSNLCQSSQPDTVLQAYFKLFPFKHIYIADLDAIQGIANHYHWIKRVAKTYQDCQFWLDAGVADLQKNNDYPCGNNIVPVLGSENDIEQEDMLQLMRTLPASVLSLDFSDQGLGSKAYLMEHFEDWPAHVIIMQLNRVGTGEGINWQLVEQVKILSSKRHFYLAGGISNKEELVALKRSNVSGALIASTLHSGIVTANDIQTLHA